MLQMVPEVRWKMDPALQLIMEQINMLNAGQDKVSYDQEELTLHTGLTYWVCGNCVVTHRWFDVLGKQCMWSLSKEHIFANFYPIFKLFIQKSSKNFRLYGRVCLVCITVNSRGVKR
jgi:hypothetical protein